MNDGLDSLAIRKMAPEEAPDCEAILRSLPGWFGIEESIQQYRRDLETMETVVVEASGRIVAFLTLNQHNPHAAEIHIIAVLEEFHRCGIGRSLIAYAEEQFREQSVGYLQVKTLGPSRESEEYAVTRRFYEAMDFRPLEETNLWGDRNPCLIMVKHLTCLPKKTG